MNRASRLAGLTLGRLLGLPAVAKEGDAFRPNISDARYSDSNLLRLAERKNAVLLKWSDKMSVHKSEICHPAQGFKMFKKSIISTFTPGEGSIAVKRLVTTRVIDSASSVTLPRQTDCP
ncbi:MAG: hypothetical protein ACYCZT_13320 [Thiobacillus sp.]